MEDEIKSLVSFAAYGLVSLLVFIIYWFGIRKHLLIKEAMFYWDELCQVAANEFEAKACSRCGESILQIQNVSLEGRSISCECASCGKRTYPRARNRNSEQRAVTIWKEIGYVLKKLVKYGDGSHLNAAVPAFCVVESEIIEKPVRRYISTKVKKYVWERDHGMCALCGSKEKLEYDHIIPFSMGGSNTCRNVQLLCEVCNRNKSNNIE